MKIRGSCVHGYRIMKCVQKRHEVRNNQELIAENRIHIQISISSDDKVRLGKTPVRNEEIDNSKYS